ncbi:hypothetical protein KIN20_016647 [Parelaphostrongylus tenuis]|uniref:Uncharacterized protein n=1 Tax=Parelaphostrongylus tenuis TaxID=148309 RepID=A0AAD5N5F9_PARTN|nr:hypothetical protein KIN20_016647 [Parelaphostrongylus tenuis]
MPRIPGELIELLHGKEYVEIGFTTLIMEAMLFQTQTGKHLQDYPHNTNEVGLQSKGTCFFRHSSLAPCFGSEKVLFIVLATSSTAGHHIVK